MKPVKFNVCWIMGSVWRKYGKWLSGYCNSFRPYKACKFHLIQRVFLKTTLSNSSRPGHNTTKSLQISMLSVDCLGFKWAPIIQCALQARILSLENNCFSPSDDNNLLVTQLLLPMSNSSYTLSNLGWSNVSAFSELVTHFCSDMKEKALLGSVLAEGNKPIQPR